jgi:hypothetical protein
LIILNTFSFISGRFCNKRKDNTDVPALFRSIEMLEPGERKYEGKNKKLCDAKNPGAGLHGT